VLMYRLERCIPRGIEVITPRGADRVTRYHLRWLLNRKYLAFCLGLALYAIGWKVPYNFIQVIALDRGISAKDTPMLPIAMGFSDSVGLVMFGILGDRCGSYLNVFIIMVVGGTLTLPTLPTCAGLGSFVTFGTVYAAFTGGRAGLLSLVCLELAGQHLFMSVYGVACGAFLLSSTGSLLLGAIYDLSGSYNLGLYAIVGSTALSVPCFIMVAILSRK